MKNFRAAKSKLEDRSRAMRVLGIMSGTSMDGVDYVLCEIDSKRIRLKRHWKAGYSRPLRSRLRSAATNEASSHALARLHHDLGRFYSDHAGPLATEERINLIGLHGQTIFHRAGRAPASFQLGEASYLVEALRVPVVSNFRSADIAAGGQGAPLATLFHETVFAKAGLHTCVNNLGGISNVTSIDWRRSRVPHILSFDTGPGNLLIDLAVQRFTSGRKRCDKDGLWASQGNVSVRLVAEWLGHRFFFKQPPKSTGREVFGEVFLKTAIPKALNLGLSRHDIVASLTELTAASIVQSYRRYFKAFPDRIILAGGGVANRTLAARIRENAQRVSENVEVLSCDQFGWPHETVEGAAFALLAYYRIRNRAANLRGTTGARRAVLLGQISEP